MQVFSLSTPKEFTLSNVGTKDLLVSDITVSDSTDFILDLNGGSKPCGNNTPTIAPGNNCTVTVTFHPSAVSTFTTDLSVTSNDPVSPAVVGLSGTGQCIYSISPGSVSLKSTGGNVTVQVSAQGATNCSTPDVVVNDSWITFLSGRSKWKNNSGTVVLSVQKNSSTSQRTATVGIVDQTLTITEAADRR